MRIMQVILIQGGLLLDISSACMVDRRLGDQSFNQSRSVYHKGEYIGITEAAKESLWLRRLIIEMGVEQSKVKLYSDSQNALLFA